MIRFAFVRFAFAGAAVLLLLSACSPTPPPRAAFLTRLGDDTLAVERFTHLPDGMEATVVLRTPRTTLQQYRLRLGPDGVFEELTATITDPLAAADAPPLETVVTRRDGDSLRTTITEGDETRTLTLAAPPHVLPFLDMIHWPFDLMLMRARGAEGEEHTQPLYAGTRTWDFVIRDLAPDSMTVTHPFRGTMGVRTDEAGRLLHLDAAGTTRKLTVDRHADVDVEALARRFAERDAAGQSFGALSGRATTEVSLGRATITVDYGTPSKRGREIFGALVPYGQVWRTGANRATHFATNRPLRLGDLRVPPGEYTLYTIPEADGGTLIVNRQTGQGGTTYNADRDLGRVPMTRTTLDEPVETFTIAIEDQGGGRGLLRLQWDRTSYDVPIRVE